MTDPISIATGVAGLVVSATRISIILHEYTYAFKDAPKDISDFSRELDGLSRILTRLQSMLPDAPLEASNTPQISQVENSENALMHFRPVGKIEETYDALAGVKSNGITKVESPFPDDYSQDLQKVLESCADVFTRIEELFKKFDIPTPASPNLRSGMAQFKNRIRWMVYSNDFAKLRAVVEAHKGTLNVTLLLLVNVTTAKINDSTADIKVGTTDIKNLIEKLIDRLEPEAVEALSSAGASDRSSIILKRYLEGAADYTDSIFNPHINFGRLTPPPEDYEMVYDSRTRKDKKEKKIRTERSERRHESKQKPALPPRQTYNYQEPLTPPPHSPKPKHTKPDTTATKRKKPRDALSTTSSVATSDRHQSRKTRTVSEAPNDLHMHTAPLSLPRPQLAPRSPQPAPRLLAPQPQYSYHQQPPFDPHYQVTSRPNSPNAPRGVWIHVVPEQYAYPPSSYGPPPMSPSMQPHYYQQYQQPPPQQQQQSIQFAPPPRPPKVMTDPLPTKKSKSKEKERERKLSEPTLLTKKNGSAVSERSAVPRRSSDDKRHKEREKEKEKEKEKEAAKKGRSKSFSEASGSSSSRRGSKEREREVTIPGLLMWTAGVRSSRRR